MIQNNTLDPIYWRVVKYYKLKKWVRDDLEIPFVLAYMRPYVKCYEDTGYHDRVDIDIQTVINEQYPGAVSQTIHMQTEADLNQVKALATGIHYNAAIQFIDDGIVSYQGIKLYRNPGRIEQLISLYVNDKENAFYLANELSEFILPGGGIIDYHIEEMNCSCNKLALHPLICPFMAFDSIGDENRQLLFYNFSEPWDDAVILYVENVGTSQNIAALFGNNKTARSVMSRLYMDAVSTDHFYHIGFSGNDTQRFQNFKEKFNRLFGNHADNRVNDVLNLLYQFEEI